MRKQTRVYAIAGAISVCLSLFSFSDGAAEDGKKGNVTQNDSSITVVMRSEVGEFSPHPDLAADKFGEGTDDSLMTLVKTPKCKGELPCSTRKPRAGDKAVDGTDCPAGVAGSVVCMASGEQLCNSDTGTCTTVTLGGNKCGCACLPNNP